MLLIKCPHCGPRPEIEFAYGGQAHVKRPVGDAVTDQEWADFLYTRTNEKGLHAERWRHVYGCGRFFNAQRDTTTDKFVDPQAAAAAAVATTASDAQAAGAKVADAQPVAGKADGTTTSTAPAGGAKGSHAPPAGDAPTTAKAGATNVSRAALGDEQAGEAPSAGAKVVDMKVGVAKRGDASRDSKGAASKGDGAAGEPS